MAAMTQQEKQQVLARLVGTMMLALVDYPEEARSTVRTGEGFVAIDVTVAATDVGKLIGKQGRTARALRTIVSAAGLKLGLRCEINITE